MVYSHTHEENVDRVLRGEGNERRLIEIKMIDHQEGRELGRLMSKN